MCTLIIAFSSTTLIDRTWDTFLLIMAAATVKTFFLWLISVVIIKKIVSKPLTQLEHRINHFDIDSLDQEDTVEKDTQASLAPNELHQLRQSVDLFCHTIIQRNRVINEHSHSLEQKIAQRTAELERLMQDLQRASEIKSNFLANCKNFPESDDPAGR